MSARFIRRNHWMQVERWSRYLLAGVSRDVVAAAGQLQMGAPDAIDSDRRQAPVLAVLSRTGPEALTAAGMAPNGSRWRIK